MTPFKSSHVSRHPLCVGHPVAVQLGAWRAVPVPLEQQWAPTSISLFVRPHPANNKHTQAKRTEHTRAALVGMSTR